MGTDESRQIEIHRITRLLRVQASIAVVGCSQMVSPAASSAGGSRRRVGRGSAAATVASFNGNGSGGAGTRVLIIGQLPAHPELQADELVCVALLLPQASRPAKSLAKLKIKPYLICNGAHAAWSEKYPSALDVAASVLLPPPPPPPPPGGVEYSLHCCIANALLTAMVLDTGGDGYCGWATALHLSARGYQVRDSFPPSWCLGSTHGRARPGQERGGAPQWPRSGACGAWGLGRGYSSSSHGRRHALGSSVGSLPEQCAVGCRYTP